MSYSVNGKLNTPIEGYIRMFHKICFAGDSLTAGVINAWNTSGSSVDGDTCQKYSWVDAICNKYSNIVAGRYATGGYKASDWVANYETDFQNDTTKYGAFYVDLGTNESAQRYSIGDIGDEVGTETYCGKMKKIIELFHANNENAPIFLSGNFNYSTTSDYNKALKSIADLYDYCFYLDYTIVESDASNHKPGGTHFDTLGYLMIANDIERLTEKIITDNPVWFGRYALDNKNI